METAGPGGASASQQEAIFLYFFLLRQYSFSFYAILSSSLLPTSMIERTIIKGAKVEIGARTDLFEQH